MDLDVAQQTLYTKLTSPRDGAEIHRKILDAHTVESISTIAAVGLDTNILKGLRRDSTFADGLFLRLKANKVALITPGQSLVEFWNNHHVFANDEWNSFRNDLGNLKKRIERGNLLDFDAARVGEISRLVQEVSSDLHETKSPEYLATSRTLVQSMLETARVPQVSRVRFADVASARLSTKTPPGFADEGSKVAAAGDFFVWADFLLGCLCVEVEENRDHFVWVTDDSKPDWKTGSSGHPSLLEEFRWVREARLTVLSLRDLRVLIQREEERQAAASTESSAGEDS